MENKKIVSQFIQDAMKCNEWEVVNQPEWIKHLGQLMMQEDWVRVRDYPVEDLISEIEQHKPDCQSCQSPLISVDICTHCIWNIVYSGKTNRFVNDGKPTSCIHGIPLFVSCPNCKKEEL
jgi:hypothetical protein